MTKFFMQHVPRGMTRFVWLGMALMAFLTVIVVTTASDYNVYLYDSILLACIGAIALQILQGSAGLVSVGSAGFMLFGAFGTVYMHRAGIPFPVDVLIGAVFAGLTGLVTGIPALRLKALFLALATLATHFVALYLGTLYQSRVEGARETGFNIPILFSSYGLASSARYWAWVLLGVVLMVLIGASRTMAERTGRAMRMMREHEHVAPVFGIEVRAYKLKLFVLTSMLFGLEGGLAAHFSGNVVVDQFTLLLAFQFVAMIIIGGIDSLAGAIIGAVIVIGLPSVIPNVVKLFLSDSRANQDGSFISLIVYGIVLVIFATSSQDGIVGLIRRGSTAIVGGKKSTGTSLLAQEATADD